jgi:hypothetical protein
MSYVCQKVVYSGAIQIAVTRIRIREQLRMVGRYLMGYWETMRKESEMACLR